MLVFLVFDIVLSCMHDMRDLYQCFVHVAYVRSSVLLQYVDDRPHRLSAGRGDGSAQRVRSVIYYDVVVCVYAACTSFCVSCVAAGVGFCDAGMCWNGYRRNAALTCEGIVSVHCALSRGL